LAQVPRVTRADAFVGRHDELAFLHEEFTAACDGRTRFVPIEGDAGIGKSRLVAQFTASIAAEATVSLGQCSEHVRSPYLPFVSLLPRLDLTAKRATVFDVTARTFEREGRRRPIVAILEDLQWADEATLELLGYLLQNVQTARLLFLVTLRAGDAARSPGLASFRSAASRARANACSLHGLRRNEIRRLVQQAAFANGVAVAPEVVAQIEVLSEGNPLFAEELARIAVENGTLADSTQLPLSIEAMLSERLAPFDDAQRAVLTRAAIIGARFDAGFLAKIAERSLDDVLGVMQQAVDAGIVVTAPGSLTTFSFRHALIRQALADRLILGLAAPMHVRIAQELASLPDADGRIAELAYHWSAARVPEKARYFSERAAEVAWNLNAYRDAIGHYYDALRWEYPAGAARADLYERLGTLLYIDGCGEEPAAWFARARDEHTALGNHAGAAHALLLLADQHWVDGRTADSLAAAGSAARMLEGMNEPRLMATARLSLARFSITMGDASPALEHLVEAAGFEPHFDETMRANFYEVRAEAHAALGRTRAALDDGRRASDLAQATGISELIAQIENNYALLACDLGELALAVERHEIALDEARRTSMTWRVAYLALNYAHTLMLQGELERARRLVWEALEGGVTTATFKTKAATVGIPLALLLNDRRLLEACADEGALRYAKTSREIQRIGGVGTAFAELRGAQGAPAEANRLLGDVLAQSRAHRCWNAFALAARGGDRAIAASALALLGRSTGRPRIRRAFRLLFAAPAVAARAFARMGLVLYEAFALEVAGNAKAALGRYAAMGDVRDSARLRGTGPASETLPLSGRQLEVANLVAAGETNRAIATRLHISEHTVEHHLTGIFARLGIRSRSQLAARVAGGR
jgi:DNA-binding CsgD family transcriptional regulator/tetratricopeptide (TPR) repeat protein